MSAEHVYGLLVATCSRAFAIFVSDLPHSRAVSPNYGHPALV